MKLNCKHLQELDFKSIGDGLKVGETINTFHCKQGYGNDRLYITKIKNGSIIAYCHHCGKRGFIPSSVKRIEDTIKIIGEEIKKLNSKQDVTTVPKLKLPIDCEYDSKKWSVLATSWLNKYGIYPEESEQEGIGESLSLRRLIIPIRNTTNDLLGYQTRRLYGDDNGPKYFTYKREGSSHLYMLHKSNQSMDKKTCVLVEDKLSAIKCSRFLDTIWLLGTNVSTNLYNFLSKSYDNVIIFLDNDNDIVREKQLRLHRILSNLMKSRVKMCYGTKDPKKYFHAELQLKLAECLV